MSARRQEFFVVGRNLHDWPGRPQSPGHHRLVTNLARSHVLRQHEVANLKLFNRPLPSLRPHRRTADKTLDSHRLRWRNDVIVAAVDCEINRPASAMIVVRIVLPPIPPRTRLASEALLGRARKHGDDPLIESSSFLVRL